MIQRTGLKVLVWSFCIWAFIGTAAAQVRNFDIPGGELQSALDAYSKQAGVQVIYRVDDVRGVTTAGATGALDPSAALDAILANTGFATRRDSSGAIAIVKLSRDKRPADPPAPAPKSAPGEPPAARHGETNVPRDAVLETITVTGMAEGLAAMRVKTPLREIPQSISVISREQIEQQNGTDLASMLGQATGITLLDQGGFISALFSRGFQVDSFHIDGGAALQLGGSGSQYLGTPDLAEYDHIEVLRGVDGLFGGAGKPSATVNLERKRPLDHEEATVTGSAGSWNNYRLEGTLTGPIGWGGALRGLLGVVYENRDFFYRAATADKRLAFGSVEWSVTPETLLTLGGSYEKRNSVPALTGLPRDVNGDDPHLPRSTSLVLPWARQDLQTPSYYFKLDHQFNDDWRLKLGATRLGQRDLDRFPEFTSAINPVTGAVSGIFTEVASLGQTQTQQTIMDATLTGAFDWLGRRQEVLIGADSQLSTQSYALALRLGIGPPLIPSQYDPSLYPEPTRTLALRNAPHIGQRQYGVYASFRVHLLDDLALITGVRDNFIRTWSDTSIATPAGQVISRATASSNDSGKAAPYVGLTYNLDTTYTLYASYAAIFESHLGDITQAGATLPAGRGANVEGGIKAAWRHGWLNGSLAVFDVEEKGAEYFDTTHPSPIPNCCFLTESDRSKGVEAELNGRLTPDWMLTTGYTYDVNKKSTGLPLQTQTPKHLLKLWTSYRLPGSWHQLNLGGGVNAQSANYQQGTACAVLDSFGQCSTAPVPFNITQGFFAVATVRVGYEITPNWLAALTVDNLFDRVYYRTVATTFNGNWYGPPRNFLFKIQGRF